MSTDGGFAGSFAQKQFYFSPLCATEHTHTNYVCVCANVGDMGACMVICVFLSSCSCHKCVSAVCLQRTFPLTPSLVIPTGGNCLFLGGCTRDAATHFVMHNKIREWRRKYQRPDVCRVIYGCNLIME